MTPTASYHITSILYIPPYPVSGIPNLYTRTSLRLVYYCMHTDPPPLTHTHRPLTRYMNIPAIPVAYAIGFIGGCGTASNWTYSHSPDASTRICVYIH